MAAVPHGDDVVSRVARAGASLAAVLNALPPHLAERLSTSQLRVLQAVQDAGQTTPSQLVVALSALPSSITRLCDRLVAAGQLERIRAQDDRRMQVVRLTGKGNAVMQELQRHRAQILASRLAEMAPSDRRALLQGLEAFDTSLGRSYPTPPGGG